MSTKPIKPTYPTKYVPPTSGLLSYLPTSWVPYAELNRIDHGRGILFSWVPSVIGLMYAANVAETPVPISTLATQAARLFFCAPFFRSAATAWDDVVDRDFDRKTPRCALRPVARGAITPVGGSICAGIVQLLGFLLLRCINPNCAADALVIIVLSAMYPFGKRVTHFVAVILGLTIAWTQVLAMHVLDVDPWSDSVRAPTLCLLGAMIMIVAFYNTCSGCLDTEEDAKNGAKSISVLFRGHLTTVLTILASATALLLHAFGSLIGMGTLYLSMSVYGGSLPLVGYVVFTKSSAHASFNAWKMVPALSYLSILVGLVGNYIYK